MLNKFNIDGSAYGKPGLSGIGGVLRDCYGMARCIFSLLIGVAESNKAEFLAIQKALHLLVSSAIVSDTSLIIESDFFNPLGWGENAQSAPWAALNFIANDIHILSCRLSIYGGLTFCKIRRELNIFADSLAIAKVSIEVLSL